MAKYVSNILNFEPQVYFLTSFDLQQPCKVIREAIDRSQLRTV